MLTIDFINVGYGDAILVRDIEASFNILIDSGDVNVGDGGVDSKRISAADFLMRENIDCIDLLVLTHLHLDHSGGLLDILKKVQIKEFWANYLPDEKMWGKSIDVLESVSPASQCLLKSLSIFSSALKMMKSSGTIIKHINNQFNINFTDSLSSNVQLELGSIQDKQKEICDDIFAGNINDELIQYWDRFVNDTSIRLSLKYANRKIELPGDVYAKCWEKKQVGACDIVKLPHHGHSDSMTIKLSEMLQPKYAIVSVSNTRVDNCPCFNAIDALRSNGTKLYFTDAVNKYDNEVFNQFAIRFSISHDGNIEVGRIM